MQAIETEYTMKSVRNILEHFFHFLNCMEKGNIDSIVIITDVKQATKRAKLTPRQQEVFFYRFLMEYTQEETAAKLDIAQQSVVDHIDAITTKIYRLLNGMDIRKVE